GRAGRPAVRCRDDRTRPRAPPWPTRSTRTRSRDGASPPSIGRDVAAVAPHRSDLHSTHRLPDVLAPHDLAGTDDLAAVRGDDSLGNRRHFLVDACADPAEYREPEQHDDAECDPETPHGSSSSRQARGWLALKMVIVVCCAVRNSRARSPGPDRPRPARRVGRAKGATRTTG